MRGGELGLVCCLAFETGRRATHALGDLGLEDLQLLQITPSSRMFLS
jgi:hypothetical protein